MRLTKALKLLVIGVGLASLVAILVGVWTIHRFLEDLISRDEVARVASPSGAVEAVLVETNGGATTSFGYEIYIVEPGVTFDDVDHVAFLYDAVRSGSAYGANLRWRAPDILSIEYLTAGSAELYESSIDVSGARIAVELRSGIEDPTAPVGGMLMNLEAARPANHQ